jgi:putative transposase
MILRRNYKYRIYPNNAQDALLRQWEGVLRFLWNLCHEQRLAGITHPRCDRYYPSYYEQKRQMTELLPMLPWIADVQCQARQEVLADLDKAWKRFFMKLGGRPRWKRRGDALRVFAPTATVKFTLVDNGRRQSTLELHGPKYKPLGALRIVLDRPLAGEVKSWTIKREGREWYAIAGLEIEKTTPVRVNDKVVGIDRGVVLMLADSEGRVVPNPRYGKQLERRIARAQRRVAKKKRGSKNQRKARAEVARLQRLVMRRRQVHVHTQSRYYADNFGVVKIEDLKISSMTASAKGTVEEPGSHVKQKSALNRAILDSGWGLFDVSLAYKMIENGGELLRYAPPYTSQECPKCGHVSPRNRISQSLFICEECGYEGNADVTAAQNICAKDLSKAVAEKGKKSTFRRGRRPAEKES